MTRRLFLFDPPDRFVAGTIGQPGNRTFFLQAKRGTQVVSVVLEKVQVAVLAERLGQLLDELEERGITPPTSADLNGAGDTSPLDEPLVEAFRATSLTLGWDGDAERILVEARAESDDDEDDDEDDAIAIETETEDEAAETAALSATVAAQLLAAFEAAEADDPDGPDLLRVRLTADEARIFVERAMRVVQSGRPPCPLCGQPLDPQGHICPRRNGHYVN